MKLNKIFAGLFMAGAIVSAIAHAEEPEDAVVGKVGRVYVRECQGLFVEKQLLRHSKGKEIWADVRTPATVASQTTGEMFKVPANLAIEHGDLVATRYGDESGAYWNLISIPNEVTKLVASHDNLMAITFGLTKSASMVDLFLSAKAR